MQVGLSAGVRSSLFSLQKISDDIALTKLRIATGKRVGSPLDGPSSYFTAGALTTRAASLNRLVDTFAGAKQTINAADQGLSALSALVSQARTVAQQARLTAPIITPSYAATVSGTGTLGPDAIATATGTQNVASQTNFVNNTAINNGDKLTLTVNSTDYDIIFDASDSSKVQDGADLLAQINAISGISASFNGSGQLVIVRDDSVNSFSIHTNTNTPVVNVLGVTETTFNPTDLLSQGISSGQTLTIQVGASAVQTITFGTNDGAGQVSSLAELNTKIAALTGLSTKSLNLTNGGISLTATSLTDSLTIGGTVTLSKFGLTAGTINPTSTSIPNPARESLRLQFNSLLSQIDQIAADAGFEGVNLLAAGSSLNVKFNEAGTSSLSLSGSAANAAGLGVSPTVATAFDTDGGIDASLAQIDAAESILNVRSVTLGSELSILEAREEFTAAMIGTLEAGADDLTLADVDGESALLLALEARQKLAAATLSITSSSDALALRLFGLE